VILYRRHLRTCKHRHKGQHYTGCGCPIWCYGVVGRRHVRESLGLRDWKRALKRLDSLEKDGDTREPNALSQAIESYLGDCRARRLAESTVRSYSKTLEYLTAFCAARDVRNMGELDLGLLTDFRAGRQVAASTSGKELETLRAFCGFARRRGWLPENYARELAPPKEDGPPTLPFENDEVEAILGACDRLEDDNPGVRDRTRARARALVLLLLYSGLRLSDAVALKRAVVDLTTGKLLLRVMKTGVPLYVRLGEPAIEALEALPAEGEYFFMTGAGKRATATGNARRTISRVLALAGVKGHPHRFRDTFSVALLEKDEDIRTVQLLLGHSSLRTTEKHYAPFVKSFQAMLDAATAKLDFGRRVHIRTKSALSGRFGCLRAS